MKAEIEVATNETSAIKDEVDTLMRTVGNFVHDTVPVHHDEKFNETVRTWGEPRKIEITGKPGACHHHQILHMIGGYDPKRGQKVAGHRNLRVLY